MNTIFKIHGGIHPDEEKQLSNPGTVLDAGVPPSLILPLSQHIGKPSSLCVAPGDYVLGGQLLAEADGMVSVPLHAPTSGTVVAIEPMPVPHPSAMNNLCLELECDGEDRWIEYVRLRRLAC
jgi:electron transport complex protein RnfC